MITRQIADDINLIRSYLSTFTTGKITPEIIDPKHLRNELIKIYKPENPKTNQNLQTVTTKNHIT